MCELSELSELSLGREVGLRGAATPRRLQVHWNHFYPVANGTICLPTRQVLAIVPFVTRRRLCSGLAWPRLSVVWRFLSCQNCSIKRTHWAHPAYAVKFALRTRHGRWAAPMMRTSAIRRFDNNLPFASPKSSGLASADVSLGGWRQCTGKAVRCKAKQSSGGKTAPTFGS
jgi:hypothetical protein